MMESFVKSRLSAGLAEFARAAHRLELDEMRPAHVFAVIAATLLGRPPTAPAPGRRFNCTTYGRR